MDIFKRIPQIMQELGAIAKERINQQQNYRYRGIDDIYNAVNASLAKHGVFCAPHVEDMRREERLSQKGITLLYTILTMKYVFYASDGSSVVVKTVGEAMDSGDKSCNKAMSAAQKYAFIQVFCIPTEEQKDTEAETHEVTPSPNATNFEFLKHMQGQKKRVGEEAYYRVLQKHGHNHANEISNYEQQKIVFYALARAAEVSEVVPSTDQQRVTKGKTDTAAARKILATETESTEKQTG